MRYKFRPLPELYFGILAAVVTYAALELAGLNPDAISDWRAWSVALAAGMVRAAAGMTLDYIRRSVVPEDSGETTVDRLLRDVESLGEEERAELSGRLALRDDIHTRGGH